jgi:hypothetical protein
MKHGEGGGGFCYARWVQMNSAAMFILTIHRRPAVGQRNLQADGDPGRMHSSAKPPGAARSGGLVIGGTWPQPMNRSLRIAAQITAGRATMAHVGGTVRFRTTSQAQYAIITHPARRIPC